MANTFKIGDIEVGVVSDGTIRVPPNAYFPATTAEQWEPHKRWLDHQGNVEFSVSCFVVRTGGKTLLIDTGMGSVQFGPFRGGALFGELASAGVDPAEIDTVFVTHLHFDHCGSCAVPRDGQLRPAFPNAVYRWTADEHAFWRAGPPPPGIPEEVFSPKATLAALEGRFEPADGGATIAPGMNVVALPGHTPGHAGIVLSSGNERAFILGDAISCPVQLEEPEWSGLGDMDPKLARRSQEAVAREVEGSGALLAAAHFPGLTFGRVLRGEGRRYWQPL
ncbi:MAG TPA: MBL fold metallo-hydrolase [Dehalococcoidia bacterium]|nr:MBL fold metallo-hydrolase [Dehalococcoidia bacterium]